MRILKIELFGYKRLNLNHIRRIVIDFREKVQFILGTNGSGKSSLLKELSPLPAQNNDYDKDGYKEITLEHQNYLYILRSDIKTQKHSCRRILIENEVTVSDEELNGGGTLTVQREIVKREFGITPDIHDLYIGNVRFTRMTVAQRRQWFTLFSKSDYTYALGVHQKFKDGLRDSTANLKMIQSRLLQEQDKIVDADKEKEIREFMDFLKKQIAFFKEEQKKSFDRKTSLATIESLYNTIRKSTRALSEASVHYQNKIGQQTYTQNGLLQFIQYLKNTLVEFQGTIDLREKDLQELQSIQKQLQNNSNLDITGLKNKRQFIYQEYEKGIRGLRFLSEFDLSKLSLLEEAYNQLEQHLIALFQSMRPDALRQNTKENYLKLKDNLDKKKLILQSLHNESSKLKLDIDRFNHYKQHNQTECPQCKYVWAREYDATKDAIAKSQYDRVLLNIETLEKENKELEKAIENMLEFFDWHRDYLRLEQIHSILHPLWNAIKSSELLFSNPADLPNLLQNFRLEIQAAIKVYKLVEEKKSLNSLIDTIEKTLIDSNVDLENKIRSMQEQIHTTVSKQREARARIQKYIELSSTYEVIEKERDLIENAFIVLEDEKEKWLKEQMRVYIQSVIDLLESEVEKQNVSLTQVDRQKHIIQSLTEQRLAITNKIEVYKILSEELSPSQGLIAKGMMGFINVFLLEINSIIRQIWLYPLELVVEEFKDEETQELDYKFKLKVNDGIPIPDIAIGSSAMKEVIDLSFQMVCMKYQGMADYPIFLDEFGHSMDNAHRFEATKTIHELAMHGSFSQIFIISHFENSYGTFRNAQMNVLCKNNIVIPKDMKYNDHMLIEN